MKAIRWKAHSARLSASTRLGVVLFLFATTQQQDAYGAAPPSLESYLENAGIAIEPAALSRVIRGDHILSGLAAQVAADRGMKTVVPALKEALERSGRFPALEASYGRALAVLGHSEVKPVLLKLVRAPGDDFLMKSDAAVGLAVLGDPSGFPSVERMLKGDEPSNGERLFRGISVLPYFVRFPNTGARETILKLAEHEYLPVRRAMARALGEHEGQDVRRLLDVFAESGDPDTASIARSGLERMRAREFERKRPAFLKRKKP